MIKAKRTPLGEIMGRTAEIAVQPINVFTPAPVAPASVNARKSRSRAATPTREVKNPARDALKPLYVLIPQDLHRKVKAKVSLEGKSLGGLVEELLEEWVTAR
jgi:hypothetical protein